jgi:hypothetical protein
MHEKMTFLRCCCLQVSSIVWDYFLQYYTQTHSFPLHTEQYWHHEQNLPQSTDPGLISMFSQSGQINPTVLSWQLWAMTFHVLISHIETVSSFPPLAIKFPHGLTPHAFICNIVTPVSVNCKPLNEDLQLYLHG